MQRPLLISSCLLLVASVSWAQDANDGSKREPMFANRAVANRFERLSLLADVCVEWHCLAAGASEKQAAELQRQLNQVAVELAKHASWRSTDYSMLAFAGERACAGRVLIEGRPWKSGRSQWQASVAKVLDDQQNAQLAGAWTERQDLLVQHSVTAMVALLEKAVGLSTNDREILSKHLLVEYGKLLLARPICLANLRHLRPLDDATIRRTLADRAGTLRRLMDGTKSPDGKLSFAAVVPLRPDPTDDELAADMTEVLRAPAAGMKREQAALIRILTERYSLDDSKVRLLETAAKGVMARTRIEWKQKIRKTIQSFEGRGQVQSTRVRLETPPLSGHPLWMATLTRILRERGQQAVVRVESEFVRQGLVSRIMISLDQELWLRADQRQQFTKIIDDAVRTDEPPHDMTLQRIYFEGLLATIPQEDVAGVLSPTQMRVWAYLLKPKRAF